MTRMTTPKQLFVHELQDVYYAEKQLTRVLPRLASEANDGELTRAFTSHLKETERQIVNLEKVFKSIGEPAQAKTCPGIDGIKKEHEEFMRDHSTTPALADVFLTSAAARAEHYEIAAYTSLIEMARALGERDSVRLLQANLKQEKDAAKKVETISKRILKKAAPSGRSRSNGASKRRSTRSASRSRSTASSRSGTRRTTSRTRS